MGPGGQRKKRRKIQHCDASKYLGLKITSNDVLDTAIEDSRKKVINGSIIRCT